MAGAWLRRSAWTQARARLRGARLVLASLRAAPEYTAMATVALPLRRRVPYVPRTIVTALALVALVALCLEYGFDAPPVPVAWLAGVQLLAVLAYILAVAASVLRASTWRGGLRAQAVDLVVIAVGGVLLALEYEQAKSRLLAAGAAYVVGIQVLLVVRFFIGAVRWNLEVSQKQLHPARLLISLFLAVILIGGTLLCLPKAMTLPWRDLTTAGMIRRVVGCFFTSTSATCVTGLTVFDTEYDFSRFGQVVILVLIQIGGLGIMIFSSLFGVLIGKHLTLRTSLLLQDALSHRTVGQMGNLVKFIVVTTFVIEALGAVLLYPMFAARFDNWHEALFHAVFHAVSAFCNAGFALHADNLVSFAGAWGVYVSIMPLIILGGLGFPVLQDLWLWVTTRLRPQPNRLFPNGIDTGLPGHAPGHRLSLHSRIVLATNAWLIVGGTVLLFVSESIDWRAEALRAAPEPQLYMIDMPVLYRARAAVFHSVSARTAGYNTCAMGEEAISPAGHLLMTLLMFIGGSPGSTAGGIKTVTIAVMLYGLLATLHRREHVEAFARTIPEEVIRRAAVVTLVMASFVAAGTFLLCLTERASLLAILFEVVSACGTVGLSTGLTPRLTIPGQLIIMAAMFAGRLGPVTVMIGLARRVTPARYEYPAEHVTIG
jgi:trk system potassium uptake protein TrkH